MKGESLLFPSIFGPSSKSTSAILYVLSLIGPIDSNRTIAVINKQVSLKRTFILGVLKNSLPLRRNKQPWNNKAGLMDNCTVKAVSMSRDSTKLESTVCSQKTCFSFHIPREKLGNKKHTFTSRFERPPDCDRFNYTWLQWHNSITTLVTGNSIFSLHSGRAIPSSPSVAYRA